MRKNFVLLFAFVMIAALAACSAKENKSVETTEIYVVDENAKLKVTINDSTELPDNTLQNGISEEMAYDGVSNYCHAVYDWSISEDNPDLMYIRMGEGTESEYQVIFRSYTGTFVYFHVDKSSGTVRLTESVPSLGIEEDAGTIDLYEYLT